MDEVKDRLEAAFLARCATPSWPALRQVAARRPAAVRAARLRQDVHRPRVAGELGAVLRRSALADVLDMYIGQQRAQPPGALRDRPPQRARACCSSTRSTRSARSARTALAPCARVVNQLLTELDGVGGQRGRLRPRGDQPPLGRRRRPAPAGPSRPDAAGAAADRGSRGDPASAPAERPVARHRPGIARSAYRGFSGADLAHLCESAAELALVDSVVPARRGRSRCATSTRRSSRCGLR